jgi:hypothetical protein
MTTTPHSSHLRYLDGAELDATGIKLDHLPVYGWEHAKLGHLDGFIVDDESGGAYYAAVHGGSWLNSRRFLLPIGHLSRLDPEKKELHADISKEAIRLFPEFKKDEFLRMTDEDMRAFERQTAAACCPSEVPAEVIVFLHETVAHYREPSWWRTEDKEEPSATPTGHDARRA